MEKKAEEQKDDYFGSIDDGAIGGMPAKSKDIALSQIANAENYLNYSEQSYPIHADFLRSVTRYIMGEIEPCFNWIKEEAEKDSGYVYMAYNDSRAWVANAKEQMGERVADITMGLGCVARLLGIANRLATALSSGPTMFLSAVGAMPFLNEFYGHKTWDPLVDPLGILMPKANTVNDYDDTIMIAKDAMLLLFFHEATHVCRGHLWIPKEVEGYKTHEVRRALEIDADWGAGRLFVEWKRKQQSCTSFDRAFEKNLIDSLTIASQCLYFAFQIYADNDVKQPHYHLPYTRAIATLEGAHSIWREVCPVENFPELVNTAYSRLGFIEKILPYVFRDWIRVDDFKTTKDQEEYKNISKKALEDGVIFQKILRLKIGPFVAKT